MVSFQKYFKFICCYWHKPGGISWNAILQVSCKNQGNPLYNVYNVLTVTVRVIKSCPISVSENKWDRPVATYTKTRSTGPFPVSLSLSKCGDIAGWGCHGSPTLEASPWRRKPLCTQNTHPNSQLLQGRDWRSAGQSSQGPGPTCLNVFTCEWFSCRASPNAFIGATVFSYPKEDQLVSIDPGPKPLNGHNQRSPDHLESLSRTQFGNWGANMRFF